ncbi:MAG: ABC transporter substrate-binding protein, partial [Anaerolineae bacterium]|nr:ABC transporter substrate-binding protein [Anaerolineae bacterium]
EEANAYLIGNIEGGVFNEAPSLAALVDSGDLPPVEERLPDNPLIIPVVEQIGTYGGTLRRGFLGPSDHNNYVRVVYDALVRNSPDGSEVIPHIAAAWESNDDFSQWTIRLRSGAKWSDGKPMTADDIMFWYNDILLNEDLSNSIPVWMQNSDGTVATVEKVSDTEVTWTYDEPNTSFLLELANKDGADLLISNLSYAPAHYLQQFHASYAPEADLQAAVDEAGFDTWTELFTQKALAPTNADRPTTAAWVPDGTTVADQVFRLTRNPYYVGVDPAGNQLPYIDTVEFTFFADKQTLNTAAAQGQIDMQGRHIDMSSYPTLKQNEDANNYHVVTWPTFGGSDAAITFNQTYETNPEIGELMRNQDFRVALSYAIDREAIKELAFLGLGEARQPVPAPNHPYYPGDEYAQMYTQFDPDTANEMLDSVGLTERDEEGFRTLPSGERLEIEISVVPAFGNWPDVAQIIAQQWGDVGVRTRVEVRERSLHFQMRDTNDLMTELWNNDTTGFPFSGQPQMDPRSTTATTFAPLIRKWYQTDGAEGVEPPQEIADIVAIIDEAKISNRARQIELAQELFQKWAEDVYQIGTVGLTPMVQGVLVVNDNLHNVPATAGNDWPLRTPGNTRPEQYFYTEQ